jgi:hypothetical protein
MKGDDEGAEVTLRLCFLGNTIIEKKLKKLNQGVR